MRAVGLFFGLVLFAGCAAPTSSGVVVRLPSGGCAAGASCSFDFGTISEDKIAAFDVVNLGDDVALVSATAVGNVTGDEFTLAQAPSTTIDAHSSSPLAIVAHAPSPGAAVRGVLDVRFKAGDVVGTIDATLSATGAANPAQTCPTLPACTFPDTPVGQTASCTVELHNDSNATETVDDISVQGPGFGVDGFIAIPTSIAPLTSVELTISATPSEAGHSDATFFIQCGTLIEQATLTINGT